MEIQEDDGEIRIHWEINNTLFKYEFSSAGFQALGYWWDPRPSSTARYPINYFRAQLGFRRFSPRGNNLNALKERLRNADTSDMDERVKLEAQKMTKEYQKRYKWATRVVNRKLAMSDRKTFLEELFFDENGNDEGGPPVAIELAPGQQSPHP